jgi:hypothetical protein
VPGPNFQARPGQTGVQRSAPWKTSSAASARLPAGRPNDAKITWARSSKRPVLPPSCAPKRDMTPWVCSTVWACQQTGGLSGKTSHGREIYLVEVTPPAARPNRAVTVNSRRSCHCAVLNVESPLRKLLTSRNPDADHRVGYRHRGGGVGGTPGADDFNVASCATAASSSHDRRRRGRRAHPRCC